MRLVRFRWTLLLCVVLLVAITAASGALAVWVITHPTHTAGQTQAVLEPDDNGTKSQSPLDYPTFQSHSLKAQLKTDVLSGLSTEQKRMTLPVIAYHHINTLEGVDPQAHIEADLRVSPTVFDMQLARIQAAGYATITTRDLYIHFATKKALPDKSILLTFDDGYEDNYVHAFPILKKYNMVGEFAIITNQVGKTGYMNWDQLKEMRDAGMGFSSHTVHHCYLAQNNKNPATWHIEPFLPSPVDEHTSTRCIDSPLQHLTTGQIRYELTESKKVLEKELGISISSIIYPHGKYNSQVEEIARSVGYSFGFTTQPMRGRLADFNHPFAIPRIYAKGQQLGPLRGFFDK